MTPTRFFLAAVAIFMLASASRAATLVSPPPLNNSINGVMFDGTTTNAVTVTGFTVPMINFDPGLATLDYTNLIDDVRVLDGMPGSGSPTALQFEVLARHLASLRANGAPPGIDPPSYYSRIGSLQLFAEAASTEAAAGSPQAAGRYAVIRQETGVLLSLVNGALRTNYALPAPPTRTTPTPSR